MISAEDTSLKAKLTDKTKKEYIYIHSIEQAEAQKNKVYMVFDLNRNSDNYCVQRILLDREQESLKILVKSF